MLNIAVLVSGGGTNLQAIIDAYERGEIPGGKLALVLSSSPTAFAIERASKHGIPSAVVNRKEFTDRTEFDKALISTLKQHNIDLIVLAGFMCILGNEFTDTYPNKIINVHPSLIPAFCGDGFYGLKVHEAALEYGVKVTGATVHFVNEVCDGGQIIAQKAVDILPDDTPQTLQKRVMEQAEWELLPKALAMLCANEQNK